MAPSPAPPPPKEKPKRKPAGRADGGYKIGGTVLPWDPDLHLAAPTPTPLFPPYNPSQPTPLSATEKANIATFRRLRARIHEGPFYTVLEDHDKAGAGAGAGTSSRATNAAASFDPFEGMPAYSQRYVKKRRRLPKLSARPYVLHYFPPELWPTLDPENHSSANPTNTTTTTPNHLLPKPHAKRKFKETDAEGEEEEEENKPNTTTATTTTKERDPDEEGMEGPVEDAFDEDDDDDDGGDYNAEQYFDDGGDDYGDDMNGGGGEEGGEYY